MQPPRGLHASHRRQFGVFQCQPLHAGATAEIDLHPCIITAAFGGDDDADTELGVLNRLADAQATGLLGSGIA